ncbi:MAG: LCP family protein [Clostridia bacterium]|jgi:anionic cell wall polymer biosynthesis LytR-Cps2A-Psr (LCP) family protein
MPRSLIDKSVMFLVLIIILIVVSLVLLLSSLRVDPVQQAVQDELMINLALILERDGRPIATELLMYYPGNARGALLDIPVETGLIIQSLNRVDRIDALYDPQSPRTYLEEISRLTDTAIEWYLILDEAGLRDTVDLLEGLPVFIPNSVRVIQDDKPLFLPSGTVMLDGQKMLSYVQHVDEDRTEAETVAQRQAVFTALVKRMGERRDFVFRDEVFKSFARRFRSNLPLESQQHLFGELARLDSDRVVLQRLTGTPRTVEGIPLLFPHYDGELVRDIVKQTLNALLNAEAIAVSDKVFTVEILNGTTERGLAQRTAEIFQGFGYEVVSVGNASSTDVANTRVLDRYGDPAAAATLANVIRCTVIESATETPSTGAAADFIIILGKNFNGRYCVD